jgi:hypothetical protein
MVSKIGWVVYFVVSYIINSDSLTYAESYALKFHLVANIIPHLKCLKESTSIFWLKSTLLEAHLKVKGLPAVLDVTGLATASDLVSHRKSSMEGLRRGLLSCCSFTS